MSRDDQGAGTSSCVASAAAAPDGDGNAPTSLQRERRCKSAVTAASNATFTDVGDPFDFQVMTDADMSALGEARHKTIGGRGVVGRLVDKARR